MLAAEAISSCHELAWFVCVMTLPEEQLQKTICHIGNFQWLA
jgi:hypothetical protein